MMRFLLAAALLAVSTLGFAQGKYPSRTVEVVVPYAPGGSTTWTSALSIFGR